MTLTSWTLLIVLSLALAADAFAVALSQGASGRPGLGSALRIGVAFGAAQGLMPLLGWGLGVGFAGVIGGFDHWIAFALLALIGAKTIREGLSSDADDPGSKRRLTNWALLGAALATSIDAAAAGVTLPTLGAPIALACAVIAGVTLLLSSGGVIIGAAVGARVGKRAELLAGVALIGIGTKVLIEHIYFGA